MDGLKVLGMDVTQTQYFAYLNFAVKCEGWNSKSEDWRKGVLMGIKGRID